MTATPTNVHPSRAELALVAAAEAAAQALPSVTPLTVSNPQRATGDLTPAFAAAVVATAVDGRGWIGLLLGEELVATLSAGPAGAASLASVAQPALDDAAAALGLTVEAARSLSLEAFSTRFGSELIVTPLMDTGLAAAVAVDGVVMSMVGEADDPGESGQARGDAFTVPAVPAATTRPAAGPSRGIEMLAGVDMELTVELGRTRMAVRDLLALAPGDVLELDRAAGSPADLLVNGRLIARGEVVVVDEDFGLRITEILDTSAG